MAATDQSSALDTRYVPDFLSLHHSLSQGSHDTLNISCVLLPVPGLQGFRPVRQMRDYRKALPAHHVGHSQAARFEGNATQQTVQTLSILFCVFFRRFRPCVTSVITGFDNENFFYHRKRCLRSIPTSKVSSRKSPKRSLRSSQVPLKTLLPRSGIYRSGQ